MALKDLVVSGREAKLMKENERLRDALRLAKSDLMAARTRLKCDEPKAALDLVRTCISLIESAVTNGDRA